MNKLRLLSWLVVAFCCSYTATAQTLLYKASVEDGVFKQTGGTASLYTLNTNGNLVEGDALVISAGNRPANIVLNPTISPGSGVTVLMKVSNVDVTIGGQFMVIGNNSATYVGGVKIKTGAADGTMMPTYRNNEWTGVGGGELTGAKFPTNRSTAIICMAYLRTGNATTGTGSDFYLNGQFNHRYLGLKDGTNIENILLGGLSLTTNTFLNTGMKIHEVRVYQNQLSAAEVSAQTNDALGLLNASVVTSNPTHGAVSFKDAATTSLENLAPLTQLTAIATPESNYMFDKWVLADDENVTVSLENPYVFSITASLALKAIFIPYTEKTITVSTDGNGSTDKTGSTSIAATTPFTITATGAIGYVFDKWVNANDESVTLSTANPYTYTDRTDADIKAIFKLGLISPPTPDDGKWYNIRSQRNATGTGPWWTLATGNGAYAIPGAKTGADNQKFTLVSTTTPGRVAFKSHDGRYMTSDGSFGSAATTLGWIQTPNTVDGVPGFLFPGENNGLHQHGASTWQMRAGYYSVNDNCTFFFNEVGIPGELKTIYNEGIVRYNNAILSTGVGNLRTQTDHDALGAILTTAAMKLRNNASDTDLQASIQEIREALDELPVKLITSTAEAPVWYTIRNMSKAGDSRRNKVIYTTGDGVQCKWEDVDLTYNKLKQLFRFEKDANGRYKIINADLPNGNLDGHTYRATSNSATFGLAANFGNEGAKYHIITSTYAQLHSQASPILLVTYPDNNYFDGHSMWQFDKVTDIVLSDTENFAPANYTNVNVTLNRTFKTTWNTLCLPFDLTKEQIENSFGTGTQVVEYTGLSGTTLDFTEVEEIVANRPYLIKVPNQLTSVQVNGVNVKGEASGSVAYQDGSKKATFVGVHNKIAALTKGDYFISGNKFYEVGNGTVSMGGYRGYFVLSTENEAPARELLVNINGVVTSIDTIEEVNDGGVKKFDIYTISGQLVRKSATSTDGLAKGIYLMNGKKVIVK